MFTTDLKILLRLRTSPRQVLVTFLRGFLILTTAVLLARPINHEIFHDSYDRLLFKLHTSDLQGVAAQLTDQLAQLYARNDTLGMQKLLDSSFGLYGFVITDCTELGASCPGQRILFTSSQSLEWKKHPTVADLTREPFALLQLPQMGSKTLVLGRLYVLSNVPRSFEEDYSLWQEDIFSTYGARRYYLRTFIFCLVGGLFSWLVLEALLWARRQHRRSEQQRQQELVRTADSYLKQLQTKNLQLADLEKFTGQQMEGYIGRIRELKQKLRDNEEYGRTATEIIQELEETKRQQSEKFSQEMERTRGEIERLQESIAEYERTPQRGKSSSRQALENAVALQFSNALEQAVYEAIRTSARGQREEWLVLHNFNVAPGKNYGRFIDCLVISRECLVVVEAKNYRGKVDAEGDFANDVWTCYDPEPHEIVSLWGKNPYHQVNEYCMNLMTLARRRSRWEMPVFGVIVFPAESDVSGLTDAFGRFYRVTTLDRLVGVLENIMADARRHNAFSKRPAPKQLESLLLGRGPA